MLQIKFKIPVEDPMREGAMTKSLMLNLDQQEYLPSGDDTIDCIIAYGETLRLISTNLRNIPIVDVNVQKGCMWRGEMAQFILNNISLNPLK